MNTHSVLSRVAMATGQRLGDWIKINLGAGVPRCSGGGRRQPVRQRGSQMGFNSFWSSMAPKTNMSGCGYAKNTYQLVVIQFIDRLVLS